MSPNINSVNDMSSYVGLTPSIFPINSLGHLKLAYTLLEYFRNAPDLTIRFRGPMTITFAFLSWTVG